MSRDGKITFAPKGVNEAITISQVLGIGAPYHLHLEKKRDKLKKLAAPLTVSYEILEEKQIIQEKQTGTILALSEDGAVLETAARLTRYQNLCLECRGSLYAKVTETDGTRCHICFTAKPPAFGDWLKQALSPETQKGDREK